MRKMLFTVAAFAAIGLSSASLSGCAGIQAAGAVLSLNVANPITVQQVYELRLVYDAAQVLAINYIKLPLCTKHAPPCSDYRISLRLKGLGPQARGALQNLDNFVTKYPRLDAHIIYNAAVDTVNRFKTAIPAQ